MILRNFGKSIVPVSSVSTSRISASTSCAHAPWRGQQTCAYRRASEGSKKRLRARRLRMPYLDVDILVRLEARHHVVDVARRQLGIPRVLRIEEPEGLLELAHLRRTAHVRVSD